MNEPSKIPAPFASSGTKNTIPLTTDERGLASWAVGFPAETSVPVTEGGVAPHRADFNGILYDMSRAIRWSQEGNMWSYDNTVEYKVDALVLYNGELYMCKTSCTNVKPTNADYWTKITENGKISPNALTGTAPISISGTAEQAIKDGNGNVITEKYMPFSGGNFTDDVSVKGERVITEATNNPVPVGSIIWSMAATVPNGYLLCNGVAVGRAAYPDLFNAIGTMYGEGDGETTFNLPNLIGRFVEGAGTAGQIHEAGLPNITGTLENVWQNGFGAGAFKRGAQTIARFAEAASGYSLGVSTEDFNASRSSPVYGKSTTVQPPSVTALPCIKAFNAVVGDPVIVASELAQEVASKLPLSGGELTGRVVFVGDSMYNILSKNPDTSLGIRAGGSHNTGGGLLLHGAQTTGAGRAELYASDAQGERTFLQLFSDHKLLFDGKTVEFAVEKGSGYLKFSDGTQICWGDFSIPSGTLNVSKSFPRAFKNAPSIAGNVNSDSDAIVSFGTLSSTGFIAGSKNVSGSYAWVRNCRYIAIGEGA